jgi:hypothetical protein
VGRGEPDAVVRRKIHIFFESYLNAGYVRESHLQMTMTPAGLLPAQLACIELNGTLILQMEKNPPAACL